MKPWKHKKQPAVMPNLDNVEEITGVVESILFRAEHTGYTVCSVRIPDNRDTVTVVGKCAAMWVGETLKAEGKWVRHKKHGFQFEAVSLTCIAPTSARGIERYLASGMIRGIGKIMSKRLVNAFGADTLRIIEKESKRLEEIEGIGPIRRSRIKESWIEQRAVRDIMIFLQSHGVGTAQSARIYRHYGNDSVALISDNPYRLCTDIWGIGFKTADEVGASIGIPPESETRARAGIIHVLRTMTEAGHCFCPDVELVLQAQALLSIPAEILNTALEHEIEQGNLIRDEKRVYLESLHAAETGIAAKIAALQATASAFKPIIADKAVPWAEKKMNLSFAPMQAEAVKTALTEKVSIITGGPGVGKTTIIRALVDVFRFRRLKVHLAAPTGRAAKRMAEATGHEAKTIHRMLKFLPATGKFEHGPANHLDGDVFILDEVSMIDTPLMNDLLGAIPDRSCLILVGDTDQLPSVGPGNVLGDLINAETIPYRKLEHIFRQERGGLIVQNAHNVNHGRFLKTPSGDSLLDFYFVETNDPDQVIQRTIELITDRIPKRFGLRPMTDIQVLTPMRKNQLGADNLNAVLQQVLNPSAAQMNRFGRNYRQGDRVMQIRNNYDKEVFNGDIGLIAKVDTEDQSLTVDFNGKPTAYDFSELDELVHAYACTIHKSQGSEYPAVVILLTTQHFKLLQRNLLYTAITRGKQLVCLVGSKKAVHLAIRNNEIRLRRTGLRARLAFEVKLSP